MDLNGRSPAAQSIGGDLVSITINESGGALMKLNHINLTVTDVPASAEFLQKYFGMRLAEGSEKNFVVLFDDDNLVLTLMKSPRSQEVNYPATFHIGFMQASDEDVNALNRRMQEDGYDVAPPARLHAWTFYVNAPGGFQVEVLC
jgi:catechol-2,3-dioxygenase